MKVFQMNLLNYNANTQFPNGGVATQKQIDLRNEMNNHGVGNVNVAAFTEVGVADNFIQANVQNALNDFGNSLGIHQGANGRQLAVIRCGRTALQDSNEVVALVVDGNANIHNFGLYYFTQVEPLIWQDEETNVGLNQFTANLNLPDGAIPDYRYIVYIDFTLNGVRRKLGFIHNRAPGHDQTVVVMQGIRSLLEQQNTLLMCGGDFNVASPAIGLNGVGVQYPNHGHHQKWYYSPGYTTVSNPLDYWISQNQLMAPPLGVATAQANRTPNVPNPVTTGSDHRGVWIDIN
ncbi:hypothetical protein [Vibrio quintilis]|uniref:Endonuclease/Exonuclease/phosphatase family protein n=1 Tax=Vibrio quintilis TaxID=1117707 RepID=A0A1M7YZ86_9VIBR|nr:hypothetical protein [Vibrio quintilis]SHO57905.1 hypothetical protein VQ7734_03675 [Vibrio quintilis]